MIRDFIWKVWLRENFLTKDVKTDYVAKVATTLIFIDVRCNITSSLDAALRRTSTHRYVAPRRTVTSRLDAPLRRTSTHRYVAPRRKMNSEL
jgi:hypothetical protein